MLKASMRGPRASHLFFAYNLLLFAEAEEDQIDCIRDGFELFCNALGQRNNFTKSLMYISPNIGERDVQRMSQRLGVLLTKELESYLGH